jgi:hypothetical protein
MSDRDGRKTPGQPSAAEGTVTLVWFLESGAVDRRQYTIVNRLRRLRDSDEFVTLQEDLRARIREITTATER